MPVVEASCFVNYATAHVINGGNDAIPFDGGVRFGTIARGSKMEGPCAFPEKGNLNGAFFQTETSFKPTVDPD